MERRVSALTFIDCAAVHEVVRFLASRCDGAKDLDGQGFNKEDAFNGHSWARMGELNPEQAKRCRDMVRKYRRQIPAEMWKAMWR